MRQQGSQQDAAGGAMLFEELRPLMFSIAYRMLGSVGEAEDAVQDAYLRYHRARADGVEIASPKAYLTTVTTRLAIDAARSARARHETYVGTWLPEPLSVSLDPDPAALAEMNDALSLAFLTLLQTLSPVERAVFVRPRGVPPPQTSPPPRREGGWGWGRWLTCGARRGILAKLGVACDGVSAGRRTPRQPTLNATPV